MSNSKCNIPAVTKHPFPFAPDHGDLKVPNYWPWHIRDLWLASSLPAVLYPAQLIPSSMHMYLYRCTYIYILIFIPVSCFLCVYKYTKMWLYMNITYDSYDIQNFSQSPCRLNCHFHCSPKSNSIDISHVVPTKFAEALGEKRGLLEDHWIQINRMEFCWEIAWDSSFLCKNAAVNLKLTLPAFLELPSITS